MPEYLDAKRPANHVHAVLARFQFIGTLFCLWKRKPIHTSPNHIASQEIVINPLVQVMSHNVQVQKNRQDGLITVLCDFPIHKANAARSSSHICQYDSLTWIFA